jgi:putative colanic acid biosynthesis glycosyltransferase
MRVLQINTTVNSGSTGRIAEDIGKSIIENSGESYIAYGRGKRPSSSKKIKIGNNISIIFHVFKSLLFDRHGLGSKYATKKLIEEIKIIRPDIIQLHNIHGYYLNINVFFKALRDLETPVVWTLHDSWSYTGHCAFYESVKCTKWKTQCHTCPKTKMYPKSLGVDNSKINFEDKKSLFSNQNVHLITPSRWLLNEVSESFLSSYDCRVINNGIDLDVFRLIINDSRDNQLGAKKILLGVASIWDKRKGLDDFISLSYKISDDYNIVLIGLSKKQLKQIPSTITGISRTENIDELVKWYNRADVFINPTYQDNFPTTNIEALACGTPVITYNTGGSPEAINEETGIVLEKGDIEGVWQSVLQLSSQSREHYSKVCRTRAEKMFNKEDRYMDYLNLYQRLIN